MHSLPDMPCDTLELDLANGRIDPMRNEPFSVFFNIN